MMSEFEIRAESLVASDDSALSKGLYTADSAYDPAIKLNTSKLKSKVAQDKQPCVIVALGSFSPVTTMHTELMEDCRDTLERTGQYEVVGGFMSPTHPGYGKPSLAPPHHRLNMVHLAVEDNDWIQLDPWEISQDGWRRSRIVLDRFREELSGWKVSVGKDKESYTPIKIMMVCGGDLLESLVAIKPDGERVWAEEDVAVILGEYGVVCLRRAGTDEDAVIETNEELRKYKQNIVLVKPMDENNKVSSTAVRRCLSKGEDVEGLVSCLLQYTFADVEMFDIIVLA